MHIVDAQEGLGDFRNLDLEVQVYKSLNKKGDNLEPYLKIFTAVRNAHSSGDRLNHRPRG